MLELPRRERCGRGDHRDHPTQLVPKLENEVFKVIDSPEYKTFRTGLTFKEVRRLLWSYSEDRKTWRSITRHTVLGKWQELKIGMFMEMGPE